MILGFDTSMATTSACLLPADGEPLRTPAPSPERLREPAVHSRELLPEIDRLVCEAGGDWSAIESIAVGLGPGTFTGLRIGIATARALAQALGVGVRPVSSLGALATAVAEREQPRPDTPIVALIDARRRQVFAAVYGHRPSESHGSAEVLHEPAALDPDALLALLAELDDPAVCVGDWALESQADLERAGAEVPPPDSGLHAVDALYVCRLGLGIEAVPPAGVVPTYLRLPDAEINRRLALRNVHEAGSN
jgi:tRNA threonylcarbamoyladenosine biosynthesis protein TsaB